MSMVNEINADTFAAEVLQSPVPVVVDLYGTYCPPCRRMMPVLEELAAERAGGAKLVKLNVEDGMELAQSLQVSAVPTLILFDGGREVARLVGFQSRERLLELIREGA